MDAPAQGGGVAETLVSLDAQLAKVTKAVTQSAQLPDEVKSDFEQSLAAFRSGMEKIMATAGGDGPAPAQGGAVAPEAGASQGAVPMTPAGVKR